MTAEAEAEVEVGVIRITVVQAMAQTSRTDMTIRDLIRKGVLEAIKVPLRPGVQTRRWMITQESVTRYIADGTGTRRGRQSDGRSVYTIRLTTEEHEALQALLADSPIESALKMRNKPKAKAKVEAKIAEVIAEVDVEVEVLDEVPLPVVDEALLALLDE